LSSDCFLRYETIPDTATLKIYTSKPKNPWFELSDIDLELLRRKKLLKMQRMLLKAKAQPPKKETGKTLQDVLVGRAKEVLEAAKVQYPRLAKVVEDVLEEAVRSGRIRGPITGEELYTLFLNLGVRVRLRTTIKIVEHGKLKTLSEKIRESLRE